MTFFDEIFDKLFISKPKNEVLSSEILKRPEEYQSQYQHWVQSDKPMAFLERVANSYQLKQNDQIGDPDVHLFSSSQSNGFAISYNDGLNQQEFQFFFDWLAERVAAMGYKKANSDCTVSIKNDRLEKLEKHYMKPIQSGDGPPFDQFFGNILIEYILIDDRPSYLKFVANTYSDRSYKEAINFDELVRFLFTFG
ncbi:MAG: hypothetical protein ACI83W_001956 [Marinoscillum sp.]|jgi:hypothetical protein